MTLDDETAIKMMIEVLEIEEEPENIDELKNWIEREGIEKVFMKIFEMYVAFL